MARKKDGKTLALAVSAVVIILLLFPLEPSDIGIYEGHDSLSRLFYMFFHGNMIHAFINLWVFLSVVFGYDITARHISLAFILAAAIPSYTITSVPTVGMSGVVYILFGGIFFSVNNKLQYFAVIGAGIALGFVLPGINAPLHLYCFCVGLLLALLRHPFNFGGKVNE